MKKILIWFYLYFQSKFVTYIFLVIKSFIFPYVLLNIVYFNFHLTNIFMNNIRLFRIYFIVIVYSLQIVLIVRVFQILNVVLWKCYFFLEIRRIWKNVNNDIKTIREVFYNHFQIFRNIRCYKNYLNIIFKRIFQNNVCLKNENVNKINRMKS